MASKIKQKIAKNVYNAISPKFYDKAYEKIFEHFYIRTNKDQNILWCMSWPKKENSVLDGELIRNSQKELFENKSINAVTSDEIKGKNVIEVELRKCSFIKDVLESNPISLSYKPTKKKIIVEYSSPNIAKPFHVGHLRSTLIGSFIANLKKKLGNNVIRLNYLGDWGTQFGMIQAGVEHNKFSIEDLKKNPISLLFKAYVDGNKLATVDDDVYKNVMSIFEKLENGHQETIESWNLYRKWTLEELSKVYQRLGVTFDNFEWESDYNRKEADKVLKLLDQKGILSTDDKGRQVATVGNKIMPLIKSDNTTLYLIRDLMAVISRKSKYKFDEMYYVVDNGQSQHFIELLQLSDQLNLTHNVKIEHVKFGRMHGMSTRKGKVVFLKDILDEARERALQNQKEAETTKVLPDNKKVADIIGVTAIIVNDLKHRRKNDYGVSWEEMLQFSGSSGNSLQYCHCRLSNLKLNSGHQVANDCDPEALLEPEAVNLVVEIAKYESMLLKSNAALESSYFVRYLFDLEAAINAAFRTLNVKNCGSHVASQRLLLFDKSQKVLQDGLRLLGVTPLTAM